MSKDIVPSTPATFPTYINRKIYALKSDWKPAEADLNAIRELLDVVQEERLVSDEEVQEWKRTEKEVLEKQNSYWLTREKRNMELEHDMPMLLFFILFIKAVFIILRSAYEVEFSERSLQVLSCWPLDFILRPLFLICLYSSGRFKFRTPTVQTEVFENEDDDDDWEDSMTTTELQTRQKALVDRWTTLEEKPVDHHLSLNFWCSLLCYANMLYFLVHYVVMLEVFMNNSFAFFLCSTRPEIIFVLAEFLFSVASGYVFFVYIENGSPKLSSR